MDENNIVSIIKDGDATLLQGFEAPSKAELTKPKLEGINRKKRRRGKFKRKLVKPFVKVPWQDKRKNDKTKRNNRFRKIVLAKTQAPFNNNQFLMEIHKPEPENSFDILRTPARTRDSSFSIDSEENYFYSLPEDEVEYLTKEFSSVYEDAQSERLSNMSKNELIQEYLLLEAKYDNLIKRTERSKPKPIDEDLTTGSETSVTGKGSMIIDRDTSGSSIESSAVDEPTYSDLLQRLKEQEEQLIELQHANEKLRLENESLHVRPQGSSSEDSESDSSSSSDSDSSSSASVVDAQIEVSDSVIVNEVDDIGPNGETNDMEPPLVNGFHSPNEGT
ncbi:Protein HEXIM1 [Operophtera brumata]|uniref:Protein HEXIM1 n=1 Tax=Operophtera brumata TaxID=104452 RepID=A0A0L7LPA7_OPEBR|nr:Protein HEXIM1 [Operophtera brumata]